MREEHPLAGTRSRRAEVAVNAVTRVGAAADWAIRVSVAGGVSSVMKGAAGAAESAVTGNIQPAAAANVSSRGKVYSGTVTVRIVRDSNAAAIGAGLQVDGVVATD